MKLTLLFFLIVISTLSNAQPPYSGTIFIDPDIIASSDPSSFESATYTGMGSVTMFDRRTEDWETVDAYLFNVVWDDGLTSVAQINAEFGSVAAATVQAEKYGKAIGQLPRSLRVDVNEIWVHKGEELFGGGNNSILIHTDQTINYENDGILEETLVHEASHTSLDAAHANSAGWKNAQIEDNEFISTYARDNPIREDIAESFLTWLAVRHRQDQISSQDYDKIVYTIPNRLMYFDSLSLNLYPFEGALSAKIYESKQYDIYPNPTNDFIQLSGDDFSCDNIRIYNLLGQDFTSLITCRDNRVNLTEIPSGGYVLQVNSWATKVYKQ